MSSVQPSGLGPPATASDDGSPSDSLSEDARRVLRLIEDERHLCAESLYKNLKGRLAVVEEEVAAAEAAAASAPKPRIRLRQNQTVKEPTEKQKQMKEAKAILARFKDALDDLEVSGCEFIPFCFVILVVVIVVVSNISILLFSLAAFSFFLSF